jgi:hypothetical protein
MCHYAVNHFQVQILLRHCQPGFLYLR